VTKGLSRRNLLMPWRRPASREALPPQGAPRKPRAPVPLPPLPPAPPAPAVLLRPPGALAEEQFLAACQRCGRCVEACPVSAILPLREGAAAGTPHIDPSQTACALCDDLACTHACPSGALLPLASKAAVRIGTAVLDRDRCTAYRGLPCRICVEVCPVPGVLKLTKGQHTYVPIAAAQPCTGCGVCQEHCPADGAIRIVDVRGGRVLFSGGADAPERVEELKADQ
jgi:ferredoxin-type protein NapG